MTADREADASLVHSIELDRFELPAPPRPLQRARKSDQVAREEPLEIRVDGKPLAVVMRTPGHDLELVSGLLLAEGIIDAAADVAALAHCRTLPAGAPEAARGNVVLVRLSEGRRFKPARFRRNLVMNSACGICGRTTLAEIERRAPRVTGEFTIDAQVLLTLPDQLRAAQAGFAVSGGLHAAALFDARGRLLVLREDVGRHNAVDKVIGAALRHRLLPLGRCLLQVSGRASFEIVQKARIAGIPVVSAVSAPSSLAVELASAGGQTLVGFVRAKSFNVYCGVPRIRVPSKPPRAVAAAPSPRPRRPPRGPRRQSGSGGRSGPAG